MFITKYRTSFHLWWKEKLVKHRKVSKYYETVCRVANFADIIKFQPCLWKQLLKTQKKVKRFGNYALKHKYIFAFSIKQKFLISGETMLTSAELKSCDTWRRVLNRVNARKTCNAYTYFAIFILYFIVVICKNFRCFI